MKHPDDTLSPQARRSPTAWAGSGRFAGTKTAWSRHWSTLGPCTFQRRSAHSDSYQGDRCSPTTTVQTPAT